MHAFLHVVVGIRTASPTKYDPRAIGGGTVIIVEIAGIAHHPALGHEPIHQVWIKCVGSNNLARYGNDAASEPISYLVRVAIGGDNAFPSFNSSTRRSDCESIRVWGDASYSSLIDYRSNGAEYAFLNALVEFRRMDAADIWTNSPALVNVRS